MSLPSSRPASFALLLINGSEAYLCADCKTCLNRRGSLTNSHGVTVLRISDVASVTPAPDDAVCVWCE